MAWNLLIGLAELDPLEGVLASQVEHRPGRADELVADCELGEGDRRRPLR